jgi:transcriptional regulator with XRE-family HTH domain
VADFRQVKPHTGRMQRGGLEEARFENTPGPKMKQAYVARLESGAENNPTLDTLRRLAKASQCKVSELVH